MKKKILTVLGIALIILLTILIGMIIYKNTLVGAKNNISVKEIEEIQNYISKIYMWKEVTIEALPEFEDVNQVDELWIWEVVKKNLEEYEITKEKIEAKAKEILGENFKKSFPEEGNKSFEYDDTLNKYVATETILDEKEDTFLLNNIIKTKEGYQVEIIEYLEDYSEDNKVIIKNFNEEELGRVNTNESETKIKEIVKNNKERFNKKKIYLKIQNNDLVVQKVEKGQE